MGAMITISTPAGSGIKRSPHWRAQARTFQRGVLLALLFAMNALHMNAESVPAAGNTTSSRAARGKLLYPVAAKGSQVDNYHGVTVADPYRWLEDADAPDTRAWVEAENRVTFDFLKTIPQRESIRRRIEQLWNFERFSVPFKQGDRYFYSRNDGLQNQSVLYWTTSLGGEPKLLLDPNTLAADGTIALAGMSVSEDGRWLAYGMSSAGSDWQVWKIREVETGKDLADELRWVKFSGASWTIDNKGFFYSRYDEPKGKELQAENRCPKLCYHQINTPQSEDRLIYHRPDQKEWSLGGGVTEDGHYLIIQANKGTDTRNAIFYLDLQTPGAQVKDLLTDFDADYGLVGNEGTRFWFRTDYQAPRGRLVEIPLDKPGKANWKELVPQSKDTLVSVSLVGDLFIAGYLKDAHTQVKFFNLDGKFRQDLDLPGMGAAGGFGGKRADKETFYSYTSYTTPATIYRLDLSNFNSQVYRQPKVAFSPADYTTEQVFYTSKDGTKVPMFITYKKGLKRNGKNPTYLYGYGGFNISLTPGFSVSSLVWMEMGGVLAIPNLRGGGEYGETWHLAGTKLQKQNVFDDFIAAGEWLIANKYTRKDKLAIGGGSNGGLLVGACMTQRPDLFAAALPAVGVMDMLRFHKFTIGWAWTADYGCADNAEEFKALYAYSPLHNIKPGVKYPSTMVTTGDHDDRVVPAHSFKFAAALQAAHAGKNPVLIRIETRAGHGAGKPTAKLIEEAADKWAFLHKTLNMK